MDLVMAKKIKPADNIYLLALFFQVEFS